MYVFKCRENDFFGCTCSSVEKMISLDVRVPVPRKLFLWMYEFKCRENDFFGCTCSSVEKMLRRVWL